MYKLYNKSKLGFAILNICLYVFGMSLADELSFIVKIPKVITLPIAIAMSVVLLIFINKHNLREEYGLQKSPYKASSFLFFIPLIVMVSVNFWFGTANIEWGIDSFLYILSMLAVGFLEEIIFRGFLFKALIVHGKKLAIIVTSVSFGVGHIVNLFTSSGMDLLSNVCQILSAIAIGFLFVIMFDRGKSLWPCILTHSLFNAFSIFTNMQELNGMVEIVVSAVITFISVIYALILIKTLPNIQNNSLNLEANEQK